MGADGIPVWRVDSSIGTTHFFQSEPRARDWPRLAPIVAHVAFTKERADALIAAEARLAAAEALMAEAREHLEAFYNEAPLSNYHAMLARIDAFLKGGA